MGRLSRQVNTPRSNLTKNGQESKKKHLRGHKKALELTRIPWKPGIDHYEPTIPSLGLTGHVNPFQDVKIISLQLSDRLPVYKRPPTL
jgi:hypothetical protein